MLVKNPFHKIQSISTTKKCRLVTDIWTFAQTATKESLAEFLYNRVIYKKKYLREYNHRQIEPEDIEMVENELRNCMMQYLNGCCLVRNVRTKDIGIVYDVSYAVSAPKTENVECLLFRRPNGALYGVSTHVAVAIRDNIYTTWSTGNNIEILDDIYFSDYLRQYL
jgi:hypothetical protein